MRRIDTPDGRFAAGDPTIRKPGTLVTSSWMNTLQDEICNAIEMAGLTLDENNPAQLHEVLTQGYASKAHTHPWEDITEKPATATRWPTWSEVTEKPTSFGASIHSITALPTSDIGPILVAEASEVWIWVSTAHYTGYRSPLCGRPVDGHTVTPLANEIDAVGGLLSKSAYAGLWGYAQENGLTVTQDEWANNIGAHWFVDVSATQFRVPDLRNQFRRFSGTDVDTANERTLGSWQNDALQNITGSFASRTFHGSSPGAIVEGAGVFEVVFGLNGNWHSFAGSVATTVKDVTTFDASRVARTATETRSLNTAYHPRIHI